MAWWEYKRPRCSLIQSCLLLMLSGMCGFIFMYHNSNQCGIGDIQSESDSTRSKSCRDVFYAHLKLKADYEGKVNCPGIVRGDLVAIHQGIKLKQKTRKRNVHFNEFSYINMTKDCTYFREYRQYIGFPMSREEEEFPIAYSMVVHEKIEMFERLLRAIYAPQNIYCVHVDEKSPIVFKEAVKAITSCFGNVFIASKLVRVVYATWSRVQADLNCMKDLLQNKVQWKYLVNTCGTDFPLKTNAEIVRALKSLNGKNSMESEKPTSYKIRRWEFHFEVGDSISQTAIRKSPPPISSPIFTGNAYIVVSRNFVQHVLKNPLAKKLIEWVKDTYSPDEHLWATLNRMPGVPGSFPFSDKYQQSDMSALPRTVKWIYNEGDISNGADYPACTGTHRRSICIYGIGDLNWLLQQHHLLANKFDYDVDDIVIQCLEEYLRYKSVYRKEQ
ncbi:hypothetical protein GDO86_006223 [Hymenochirus boettgeri]|uniref:Beta-1,3-galactosyl-O-glycosyl-glycoprotein beta-1,6-N-acetylglucosaminyltransferase 3 n=1 Tax=Hymenochirus boettgeri TaxID=247094 RepID=A0A8T2J588_9PIPI|nr:hypothetical protein GDO86_006223 [Hymenochirus boettgeri]